MASLDSTLYAAQISSPPRLPDAFLIGRAVQRAYVPVTLDLSTYAANDTLNLIKLPPDAVLIPHLCRVSHQGSATTLTISLRDSAGTLLVAAAVDALTAGGISFAGENLEAAVLSDGLVVAKLDTEAASAAGDVIQFWLAYTHRGAV